MLYKGNNFFGCRHCFNLMYHSQKLSGIYKKFGVIDIPKLQREASNFKRWYYKNKPTKKFLRFIKKYEKAMALAKAFNARGDARLKKTQKKTEKFIQKKITGEIKEKTC